MAAIRFREFTFSVLFRRNRWLLRRIGQNHWTWFCHLFRVVLLILVDAFSVAKWKSLATNYTSFRFEIRFMHALCNKRIATKNAISIEWRDLRRSKELIAVCLLAETDWHRIEQNEMKKRQKKYTNRLTPKWLRCILRLNETGKKN